MAIGFAIFISVLVAIIFILGVAHDDDGVAGFGFSLCLIWCIVGLGLVGITMPSSSYPHEFIEVSVIQMNEETNGSFNLFMENGETIQFDRISQLVFKSAKKLVFKTGQKNLYGLVFADEFDEVKSKIAILKPNNP